MATLDAPAKDEERRRKHRDYMREYMRRNPDKRRAAAEHQRALRIADPERIRANEKASRLRHRDKRNARDRAYKKRNADRVRAYNAAYQTQHAVVARQWRKKWAVKHPEVYRTARANRRAREMSAMPHWVDQVALRKAYAECLKVSKETGVKHHVDHIEPLQGKDRCGLHVPWNLQIIPAMINHRKNNKTNFDVRCPTELRPA